VVLVRVVALQQPTDIAIGTCDIAVEAGGNEYVSCDHVPPVIYTPYILTAGEKKASPQARFCVRGRSRD
jgi:hypothetical protein